MKKHISDIPNTFLPRCRSRYLSLNAILAFLKLGLIQYEDLPREVRHRINECLKE